MAECIDREALIAWLKRIPIKDLSEGRGLCRIIMEEDFKRAIRELPGEMIVDVAPEGWISVKDKLPEPEQDVLVIAHGWSGRLLYIGSYQRMEAETSWLTGVTSKASDWSLRGWSYLREPEVTHWMPLPEPPMSARMDGESNGKAD